jgi:hypothetical protein
MAIAAAAVLVAGCSLLTSFDGFTGASTSGASCPIARWPGPPAKDDGPGEDTVLFAWTSLGLAPPTDAGAGTFGYDIDGVCTCPDRGSCKNPLAGSKACDEPGTGRDNNFGQLVALLVQYGAIDEKGINQNVVDGKYGIVLRIDGYNGLANDTKVSVGIYDANGVAGGGAPKNDGNDDWIIDTNSIQGPTGFIPAFLDQNAYVAGGVLVASFPRFELRLSTHPDDLLMEFDVTGVHLTAHLTGPKGQVDVDRGVLAGRISLATLESVATVRGICTSVATQALEQTACALLDVASDYSHDKAADLPCDALSAALAFTAVHTKLPTQPAADRALAPSMCDGGVSPHCM